jgi:outer membrane protein assembly factor BamE (lipoprotein component of BamABCDE complex)
MFLILLPLLSGCTTIDIHGSEVEPEQLAQIKIGVTTKDEVRKLLGTPSSVAPFGNSTWYYMFEETERRAFFDPKVVRGSITRIEFDEQNRVVCFNCLSDKDYQTVAHNPREEETSGHSFGVVEQIFGNFGQFNGKDPDQ